jgi:hypothetical protein
MSDLSVFLKQKKIMPQNVKYRASAGFVGEDGLPVEWVIKALDPQDIEDMKKTCVTNKPVTGKKYITIPETDFDKFLGKMAAASTVYPDLKNSDLQDSYGVMGEDALLKVMLVGGEYDNYLAKVQEVNRYNVDYEEMVEEGKN